MKKKTLHTVYTCGIHHVIYFPNKLLIYFSCDFYMRFIYILYTSHTHWRSRWRSKSGDQKSWRWSKNTFSQKCLGTFGVSFAIITGTQEQVWRVGKNHIFFKKSFEVKKDAELPPEYFPCGGSAWILTWSWFINFSKSHIFAIFGPLGPNKGPFGPF